MTPLIVIGAGLSPIVYLIWRARRSSARLPAATIDHTTPLPDGGARIEVVTSFPSFSFFYKAVQPNVRLDGTLHSVPWGTSCFDVAPGPHRVVISYPWLITECGAAALNLVVQPGETKHVSYAARAIRFVPGKISADEQVPEARALRD